MNRTQNLQKLKNEQFDICIIGAGASGAGCALDATLRGFKVALIDQQDFASETSSRSTKLIHGGVRYLEQAFKKLDFGQLRQVKHGLEERHIVIQNAPYLAHPLALLTPVFSWIEGMYFTIGLTIYSWFAKNDPLPKSKWLSRKETFEKIPTLSKKTHSAVMYYDGQLDDARYCLALAHSADEAGATVVNHLELIDFERENSEKINRALLKDTLTEERFEIKAKLFINCTGPYADTVRLKANTKLYPRIRPSKGVHIMLPYNTLNSESAILIPKTKDGRVVFVIPFEGEVMVGTTDTEYDKLKEEPILLRQEVDFLLDTLAPYLDHTPDRNFLKSGFGGLRPLISASKSGNTKSLLRDHEVEHDPTSNLLSLMGGKWTTYRLMAQDTIDEACRILNKQSACTTSTHLLVGSEGYDFEQWANLSKQYQIEENTARHLMRKYGNRAERVLKLIDEDPIWKQKLVNSQPHIQAEVVYAVREEMACSLRDILARRTRLELIDWQETKKILPLVADLMQTELSWTNEQKERNIKLYMAQLEDFISRATVL